MLAAVILPVVVAEAQSPAVISVSTVSGQVGETVTVEIRAENVKGKYAGQLMLTYDPQVIVPTGIKKGELTKDMYMLANLKYSDNAIQMVWIDLNDLDFKGITSQEGVICILEFNLKKVGVSSLSIKNLILSGVTTGTPKDGRITVNGTSREEPDDKKEKENNNPGGNDSASEDTSGNSSSENNSSSDDITLPSADDDYIVVENPTTGGSHAAEGSPDMEIPREGSSVNEKPSEDEGNNIESSFRSEGDSSIEEAFTKGGNLEQAVVDINSDSSKFPVGILYTLLSLVALAAAGAVLYVKRIKINK